MERSVKTLLLEGLNRFNGANLTLNSDVDVESISPTMATMQGTKWNDYHPIALLDSYHAPIEFVIPPPSKFYAD